MWALNATEGGVSQLPSQSASPSASARFTSAKVQESGVIIILFIIMFVHTHTTTYVYQLYIHIFPACDLAFWFCNCCICPAAAATAAASTVPISGDALRSSFSLVKTRTHRSHAWFVYRLQLELERGLHD